MPTDSILTIITEITMDQKNKREGFLPVLLSFAFIAALAVLFFILYSGSKYLLYLLSSLVFGLFSAFLFSLITFGVKFTVSKPEKPEKVKKENLEEGQKKGRSPLKKIKYAFLIIAYGIGFAYHKTRKILGFLAIGTTFAFFGIYFATMLKRMTSIYKIAFWQPVFFVLLFIASIILDKWCKHATVETNKTRAILHDLRQFFYLLRIILVLLAVTTAIKLLGFAEIQKYAVYIICAVFYYTLAFMIVSCAVLTLRRELWTSPRIVVLLPFFSGDTKAFGVISFLEKNTGITMRGLWSMRFIKTVLPYSIIAVVLLFWLSTGIVQIEPYQQGALYRFGKLSDDVLAPGIHMTLPYPLDKVEIYDTETLNKLTIGYASKEDSDNLWTGTHGTNEHKLLLGNGNELVSVNLRIEYKIGDLNTYLRSASEPSKILEAQAYELITERIIDTDLDTLLSVDRSAFAQEYTDELKERIEKNDIGLEIVTVVLESIHPPLEIAAIYQQIIGAQIEAEAKVKTAQSEAEVTITKAEAEKNASINSANAEYHQKTAAAIADVAEFSASVEADKNYSDAYRYYKYLGAIASAYGKADLIIVGDGVDSSKIYFANGSGIIVK